MLPIEDLRLLTGRLLQVGHRVDAATLRLLHRAGPARSVVVERGWTSTAAWLRAAHRLHPATATRLVRTAKALHDDPAGPLVAHPDDGVIRPRQELRDAFAAGQVSAEHVAVITTAVTALPDSVDPVVRMDAETALVQAADRPRPARPGRTSAPTCGTPWTTPAGQDLADKENHQVATRELQIRLQNDGSSKVRGHLDPELTAAFCSQLNPLAAPQPDRHRRPPRPADPRPNATPTPWPSCCAATPAPSCPPPATAPPATVTVTMTLDTLQQRAGAAAANLDWCGPISVPDRPPDRLRRPDHPGPARQQRRTPRRRTLLLPGHPSHLAGPGRPRRRLRLRRLRPAAGMDRSPPPDPLGRLRRDFHRATAACSATSTTAVVHHDGWDVGLIDGAIHVIPPPWIDPARTPRRNTQRAALATLTDITLLGLPEPDPPEPSARE